MKRGSSAYRSLDRLAGIPVLCATALFARRRKLPDSVKRIGVFASPTIGDALITSAAAQDIKRHFPDAHLIYFAAPISIPAVKLLPCVDEIAPIKITQPFNAIRILRRASLDLLLDFTPWSRLTALCSAHSAAKCRAGFKSLNQYRHYHYDLVAEHSPHVHELENFSRLIRSVGITPMAAPYLNIPESFNGPRRASRVIVFHPWASGHRAALREWPLENWAALALRLNRPGTLFLITGSPAEKNKSDELCHLLNQTGLTAEPFQSPNGLGSLAAMLKQSDLVVSVNTGILHLAALTGAPTIALNGPTATRRWGPIGPHAASVEPQNGGGGFLHFGFEFDGNPTDTMQRIRVEDVFQAAMRLMPERVVSQSV